MLSALHLNLFLFDLYTDDVALHASSLAIALVTAVLAIIVCSVALSGVVR